MSFTLLQILNGLSFIFRNKLMPWRQASERRAVPINPATRIISIALDSVPKQVKSFRESRRKEIGMISLARNHVYTWTKKGGRALDEKGERRNDWMITYFEGTTYWNDSFYSSMRHGNYRYYSFQFSNNWRFGHWYDLQNSTLTTTFCYKYV